MKLGIIIKVIFGFMALFLGFIGLALPILPTTPFVLVAIACFSSTPKIQEKILKIHFVKEYHESYSQKKGLSLSTVLVSLSFLWGMLILSSFLVDKFFITCILALVGSCVTIHILCIARLRKNFNSNSSNK